LRAHVPAELLNEVDGAGDIGVDHLQDVIEVLIQEALAKAPAGVGQQGIDLPPSDHRAEFVDAFDRGEVCLDGIDLRAKCLEICRSLIDLGLVSGDDQIESVLGAAPGELIADAGGSSRHDCERPAH
jgi:hypothetical protein